MLISATMTDTVREVTLTENVVRKQFEYHVRVYVCDQLTADHVYDTYSMAVQHFQMLGGKLKV